MKFFFFNCFRKLIYLEMKLLILIIFSIKLIASLKREDYCYKIEECNDNNHLFDCGHGICSIDRNKCQKLAMFYLVKNFLI